MRRYSSCSYCGASVEERHVRMEMWFGDSLIVFEDVPAGVCDQCGEEYLSADIQDKMYSLTKTDARKRMDVPVYTFTDPLTVAKASAKQKKRDTEKALEREPEQDVHLTSDDELSKLLETDFEEWDDGEKEQHED